MTNKIRHSQNDTMLIDNSKVIVGLDLVEAFNDHYINIVEKSGEKHWKSVSNTYLLDIDVVIVETVQYYSSDPNVRKIEESLGNVQNIEKF